MVFDLKEKLLIVERVSVSVAAAAALFPLWQYVNEAQDRDLDRTANFILAYRACFDEEGALPEDKLLQTKGHDLNVALAKLAKAQKDGEDINTTESLSLKDDLEVTLNQISKTLTDSCKTLDGLYQKKDQT